MKRRSFLAAFLALPAIVRLRGKVAPELNLAEHPLIQHLDDSQEWSYTYSSFDQASFNETFCLAIGRGEIIAVGVPPYVQNSPAVYGKHWDDLA